MPQVYSPTTQNEEKSGSSKRDIMPKKTALERFRDFEEASSTRSNKPMTKGEIAIVVARKKRKAAAEKRSAKSAAKKKPPSKKTKKSKRG